MRSRDGVRVYWAVTLLLGVAFVAAASVSLYFWAAGIAAVDAFAYWRLGALNRRANDRSGGA